jgi:LPS-assembly protein
MLSLAFALLLPLVQQPEDPQLQCSGEVSRAGNAGLIRCTGGATVTYQDVRVDAGWIEYSPESKDVRAGDRVRFTRAEEKLEGGELSFNLETRTGTFKDASGQIEGFYIKAAHYERKADGRWYVIRSTATTCSGECPTWSFNFREATVNPGKDVRGKGMVLRFQRLPVFYAPRFRIPTERQDRSSGFLIPSTSNSTTKGRSIRQSYFWAINRSADATVTAEYFTKRGPAGTIDFRATPNDKTRIEVSTFFAIDRMKQGGQRTNIRSLTSFGKNDSWRGVTSVDITSSFAFRQIYEEGFNLISSPIEQSQSFLTNNRPRSSLNFVYDRSAIFFPDQPTVALRKFPAMDVQLPLRSLGTRIPVYFSLEGGFAGMSRRDNEIQTPAWVQRVDIHPSIDIPVLSTAALTWSHHVGVRDTFYTHSIDLITGKVGQKPLNRGVFDYVMKVGGPQLERDFGSWRHVIESDVQYRFIAGVDRFMQTIEVDETDLVTDTNELEYGITNRFFAGWEFLTWRIAQKLYFDPNFGGALQSGRRNALDPLMTLTGFAFSDGEPRRFSPVVSTFRIATSPNTSTDIEVDYDAKRQEFRSAGIMGGLNRGPINSSLGYFFNKPTAIQSANNQLRGLVSYGSQAKLGMSVGVGINYDVERSLFQGATTQLGYNSDCYGLSLEFTTFDLGNRKESRLRFSLSLKNIGSFGTLRPQERLF